MHGTWWDVGNRSSQSTTLQGLIRWSSETLVCFCNCKQYKQLMFLVTISFWCSAITWVVPLYRANWVNWYWQIQTEQLTNQSRATTGYNVSNCVANKVSFSDYSMIIFLGLINSTLASSFVPAFQTLWWRWCFRDLHVHLVFSFTMMHIMTKRGSQGLPFLSLLMTVFNMWTVADWVIFFRKPKAPNPENLLRWGLLLHEPLLVPFRADFFI